MKQLSFLPFVVLSDLPSQVICVYQKSESFSPSFLCMWLSRYLYTPTRVLSSVQLAPRENTQQCVCQGKCKQKET